MKTTKTHIDRRCKRECQGWSSTSIHLHFLIRHGDVDDWPGEIVVYCTGFQCDKTQNKQDRDRRSHLSKLLEINKFQPDAGSYICFSLRNVRTRKQYSIRRRRNERIILQAFIFDYPLSKCVNAHVFSYRFPLFLHHGPIDYKKNRRGDAFHCPTGTLRSQMMRLNIESTQMSRCRLATEPNGRTVVVIVPNRR